MPKKTSKLKAHILTAEEKARMLPAVRKTIQYLGEECPLSAELVLDAIGCLTIGGMSKADHDILMAADMASTDKWVESLL